MSAYYILTPFGQHPCSSRPLLDSDSKGWRTVKRCMTTCRRKRCRDCERGVSRIYRIRSDEELEEEADLDNWEDVEHSGRVTYTQTAPAYEHNGSLFDLGSRF